MLKEAQEIDSSAIKDLRTIKEEQEVLQSRLEKMLEKRESVSTAVFERVRADYQARYDSLEEQASPLKEVARAEYAKLRALMERLEKNLAQARLEKEEVEFRHELGEYEEGEYKSQLQECEQRAETCEAELAEGNALKTMFIEAFHSEEELLVPAAEGPPPLVPKDGPPPPPPEAVTVEQPLPKVGPPPKPTTEQDISVPPGLVDEEEESEDEDEEESDETMSDGATAMMPVARLVALDSGEDEESFPLRLPITSIGRLETNDIAVHDGTVSRYHAKIALTDQGFTIYDLDSENGVLVNGERVRERLLADGDKIELGPGTKAFLFHEQ